LKPVVASTAYLLISHGSRDPRPQEAMNRLASLVRRHLEAVPSPPALGDCAIPSQRSERLFLDTLERRHEDSCREDSCREDSCREDSGEGHQGRKAVGQTSLLTRPRVEKTPSKSAKVIVGTACLELSPISLSEQIYRFGLRLQAAGVSELKLLPIFLMSGVHVMQDIPAEVEAARALLSDHSLELTLCPHLGSHHKITEVLASRLAAVPAEGSLLVAHGSRQPRGNRAIKGIAQRLNTAVAYWATPPDIETQVIGMMQQGCQRLTILPYFLFAGGITDAIAHLTEELAERFPKVNFRLLPTLGATDEIADLAVELIRR
jgi:sirohydrochlorin cobaltochelatase